MYLLDLCDEDESTMVMLLSGGVLTLNGLRLFQLCQKKYYGRYYKTNSSGVRYLTFSKTEIAQMLDMDINSISTNTLVSISEMLPDTYIMLRGEELKLFTGHFPFISGCSYENGSLTVFFSDKADRLFEMPAFLAKVSSYPLIHWESKYSYFLHNLLLYYSYKKGLNKKRFFELSLSLEEIEAFFNISDLDIEPASQPGTPYLVFSLVKKYSRFAEMKRCVLDPALIDINTNPQSLFKVSLERVNGAHNKTTSLVFKVEMNGKRDISYPLF